MEFGLFRDVHPPAKSDACAHSEKDRSSGGSEQPLLRRPARPAAVTCCPKPVNCLAKTQANVVLYFTDDGNDSLATDKDMAGTAGTGGTGDDDRSSAEEAQSYQSQEANLRRDADRLQALIDGSNLGPRAVTPPPSTSRPNVQFNTDSTDDGNNNAGNGKNKDKEKRKDRRPTVDLEEESYRRGRKELRDRERLQRRSRSESHRSEPHRNQGPAPLSPWSALGRSGRPEGYSRDQVNALGVAGAIALKGWEREEDRHREALIAKPGEHSNKHEPL